MIATKGWVLDLRSGGNVTLVGGDFRWNGIPIPGTEVGSTVYVQQSLPVTGSLSGILADGTPFVFAGPSERILLAGNIPALQTVALPDNEPRTFVASKDRIPRGIRAGQAIIVDVQMDPAEFAAGSGSVVDVITGGVASPIEAFEALINVTGGHAGNINLADSVLRVSAGQTNAINAYNGSNVWVSGGKVVGGLTVGFGSNAVINGGRVVGAARVREGSRLDILGGTVSEVVVEAGSSAMISGGTFGTLRVFPGGDIYLVGTEFLLYDAPVQGLTLGRTVEIQRRDTPLHGVLADGSPFSIPFQYATCGCYPPTFSDGARLFVTLVPEPSNVTLTSCLALYIAAKRRRTVRPRRW